MISNSYIKEYTNEDIGFYGLMYKHIAYREVSKESGSPIYDEDNKIWCLLFGDDGIIGFISLKEKQEFIMIDELYIKKQYRLKGFADKLIKYVIKKSNKNLKVICNNNSKKAFLNNNFKINKEYKNWTHMEYRR